MVRTSKDYENEFIEIPTGPGKHGEPMIRGKGPKICLFASNARYYGMTAEEILDNGWKGYLTLEEINAALDFAEKYPWLIDWDRYKPEPEEVWHRD